MKLGHWVSVWSRISNRALKNSKLDILLVHGVDLEAGVSALQNR